MWLFNNMQRFANASVCCRSAHPCERLVPILSFGTDKDLGKRHNREVDLVGLCIQSRLHFDSGNSGTQGL
jgi:hypothetical protein